MVLIHIKNLHKFLEFKVALNLPANASFKHLSPTRAAFGLLLNDIEKRISSFGDWITLSNIGYIPIAKIISQEIDPNYEPSEIETHQSLLTMSSTEA
ncbi:29232_t:CDS:2 [Gigaspora margarita]|uniref:29232_t:CDS:1 n=1 Tax=Gigaspora margarita TaxID=4874 RepID=A0ABN7URE1_GIGMA|nr:29232_t:CDS:2 [Gigaspora margarita]